MTNVIHVNFRSASLTQAQDEAIDRLAASARKSVGSQQLWGALRGSVAVLTGKSVEDNERTLREFKSQQLRELLAKTVADLAVHDGPLAMIEFALPRIKAYRNGGCSNE